MTRIIARSVALAAVAAASLWAQPTITTTSPLPAATVGTLYSQTFAATEGGNPCTCTWSATGLPGPWLSMSPSGVLSGTPPATAISSTFMVTATDGANNSTVGTFTLPVALSITTTSPLPQGTVGTNYSQTLTAVGGSGQYAWSVSLGALPGGLLLNATTGAITGQPTTAATSTFTIQATDTNQATASKQFSLTVNPAIVITTSSPLPQGTVGTSYSQALAATGGSGTYTWSVSVGSLPANLSLNAATGTISGQPTTATTANFTIQATDTNQATASKQFSLTINPAIVITTSSPLPQGTVGVNYSQTLAATGGSGTYTWAVSVGSLPGGLLLNATTGTISGQPTTAATTPFTIQATDTNQATSSKQFSLTINPAIVITTSSPLPQGTVGTNYSQSLAATGGSGTYTWVVSAGSLPANLSLNAATGVISGQPTTANTANFTIQATDTNQATASKQFALTVNPAIVITTSSPLPTGTAGVNYSQNLAATGGSGTYTWAVSVGSLPGGLSLNPSTGLISGQPTSAAAASFTIQATDSNQATASKQFALTINPALVITTTSLPQGTVGVNYSAVMTATGGSGTYTWVLSAGSLPATLALNAVTGKIGGQPTTASTSTFTIQVTDSNQATASQQFSLTVNPPLGITTSSPLANGSLGIAYNQTLTGTGGELPYTWSLAGGSLPNGLSLASATGAISGAPTAIGASQFTIQVTDSSAPQNTFSKQFAITISAGLTITTPPELHNATVGAPYSQTLAAAGGAPPYTWSPTGALPAPLAALSLSASGAVSGTPAATGTGTFSATVTDSAGSSAKQTFTLSIVAPPVINTSSPLPNATAGASYSQGLTASGGTSPYTWTLATGSLPIGLSLASATGTLSGAPSTAGTSSFTVQLTDATGVTAAKAFMLTVLASVTVSSESPLPTGEVSIAYAQKLIATGGTSPYTWTVISGALPPGLTLAANGNLSGTPATAGAFGFTVRVTDSNNLTASAAFAVTVAGSLGISTPSALDGGSVNVAYTQSLAASAGVAPYTWSLAGGAWPPGLSLSAAGVVSGSPTAAGTFAFVAKVADTLGATASRQFTLVVAIGLTIATPPTLPVATVGIPYTVLLQASGGGAPYTWKDTAGSPPAGVSVGINGNLSGTPTATGSSSFTVQVTDSLGHQASAQLSLTVARALSITTNTLSGATVGSAYSQPLAATGGTPPYTWSLSNGSLPGGLTLSAAGSITGTASAAGTFTFTVKVTDSAAFTASKQLTITVAGGLSITTAATLPGASLNAGYAQTLAASGGAPPYTWALTSGALPAGLTLSAAGVIAGAPTATGTFQFTATVTDSASTTASQQFTLTVAGLAITPTTLPGAKVGASYSQTLTATGGTPPYTFATSAGSLPPGLALKGAVLSGTPTAAGSYTFSIQVTDSASATATQQYVIAITGLIIATPGLPSAAVGTAYSQTLSAEGTPPYTWAILKGALPGGLTLDESSGTIGGTPTAAGTSNVTIQVTDGTQATATEAFTLTVISASFTGLPATAGSAQQVSFALTPGAAYPQEITGQVTLAFQPDASLASPADDPAIQFSTGGVTASFIIPANSTAPVVFSLQTGTVAGSIALAVDWQAGGAALATPTALAQTISIAPAVPIISAVSATTTTSGFQVTVTAFSNTREVSQAVLQFTPAAGQTLQTTSLTVSLTSAAATWFQDTGSDQYGGQFILTLPFSVTDGSASAVGSVSVQLVNSVGTSTPISAAFGQP